MKLIKMKKIYNLSKSNLKQNLRMKLQKFIAQQQSAGFNLEHK